MAEAYISGFNKGFTTASAGGRIGDHPAGCTVDFLEGWRRGFADYQAIARAKSNAKTRE